MNNTLDIKEHLPALLDIARLSPSVHNAQPWVVSVAGPDTLLVSVDKRHKPEQADPTGRQTIISLGIFVEALGIAAGSLGLGLGIVSPKGDAATVQFVVAQKPTTDGLVQLLHRRSSDRSVFTPVTLTPDMVRQLESRAEANHVVTKVITDRGLIQEIADLTSRGIAVALSSPAFRKELSGFLVSPWSGKKRGIAVRSLYIGPLLELFEPLLMRLGIGLKAEAALEKRRWESASGVVAILADGDMPRYWFEVGRAYLRASLQIEALELSQATSAAIVEASNYHEDIEQRLGTNQRLLALIRIGKGNPRRHYSPRVEAEKLLT